MVRPLRITPPGELFHILARGNARESFFLDDADRRAFLIALSEALERFRVACHGYCLMGNHYHLLLEPFREGLSGAMRHLNGRFAQGFNRRRGRIGHVFGGRFKSLLVDREVYFLELLRYLALNPVRTGVAGRPEDWAWSSHRALAGLEPPAPFLTTSLAWRSFDAGDTRAAQSSYRRFVNDGIPESRAVELDERTARGGLAGEPSFLARFNERLGTARFDPEHSKADRFATRPMLPVLFSATSTRADRDRLIRSACLQWGYSGSEVARYLGVSRSTVSRAVRVPGDVGE